VALLTGDDLDLDQVTHLSMTMLMAALSTLTDRTRRRSGLGELRKEVNTRPTCETHLTHTGATAADS